MLCFILLFPFAVCAQVFVTTGSTSALIPLNIQQFFIGSSFILTLMCFTCAYALRSYSIALLALFFAIKSLGILVSGGMSFFALFTHSTGWLNTESVFLSNLSNMMFFCFTIKFFSLNKQNKASFLLLLRLAIIMCLTLPLSYVLSPDYVWLLSQVPISISLLVLYFVIKKISSNTRYLPKIFTVTLVVQLSFNVMTYGFYFGQFPRYVVNGIEMLAFGVMAMMVTYLMARRYYCYLRDEKSAQQQVLDSAKASDIAQKKLFTMQSANQEQLESRVQERTLELNIALQELEAVNQELKEKNTLDELSGLYNRRYYDQKFLAEFRRSRRNLTPLSLVLVDIDHFKSVNDNYGHLTGDKCIVDVAKLIKSLLRRSTDVSCRYGGEEFCLILPETDEGGALSLAQDICQSVRELAFKVNENTISLTVSCGVSTYQQEKDATPETIFECVDKALYQAKKAGRDQVHVGKI